MNIDSNGSVDNKSVDINSASSQSQNVSNSNIRLTYIDSLKGFLILCVVLGHILDGFMSAEIFSDRLDIMNAMYIVVYSFHMPVFYFVSGYLFGKAYIVSDCLTNKRKIITSIGNFVVVYFVFSCLLVLVKLVFAGAVNNEQKATDILWLWRNPIGPYWYLYSLCIYYAVTRFILRRLPHTIVLIAMCIASIVAQMMLVPESLLCRTIFHLPFFFAGVLLIVHKLEIKLSVVLPSALVAIAIVVWGVEEQTKIHLLPLQILTGLGMTALLWCVFARYKWLDNIVFRTCGLYCLEIYVMHCFFTGAFRSILPKLGITTFCPNLLLNLLLSAVIPIVVAYVLKQIGIHKYIFRPITVLLRK